MATMRDACIALFCEGPKSHATQLSLAIEHGLSVDDLGTLFDLGEKFHAEDAIKRWNTAHPDHQPNRT